MKKTVWTDADQMKYFASRRTWLGSKLQALRQKSRMSVDRLADRAGLSTKLVSHIESGQVRCDNVTLNKIASVLGFNSTDVLIELNEKTAVTSVQKTIAKVFARFKSRSPRKARRRRAA